MENQITAFGYILLKKKSMHIYDKFQITSTKLQTISNDQNSNDQNTFGIFPPEADPPLAENLENWNLFVIWNL
ncbi:MAG: hypothetical protein Q7R73_04790 [bacterium]|nr:hypothetical protein [bacterium]